MYSRSSEFPQALLHEAAGRPFWLCGEGAQQLLSSQCRSCGAVSSYIWLLGLRWPPFLNRKQNDYKGIIIWFMLLLLFLLALSLFVYLLVTQEEISNLKSISEKETPQKQLWPTVLACLTCFCWVLDLAYSVGFCVSVYSYIVCWVSGLCTFPSKTPTYTWKETIWYKMLMLSHFLSINTNFSMHIIQSWICCCLDRTQHLYSQHTPHLRGDRVLVLSSPGFKRSHIHWRLRSTCSSASSFLRYKLSRLKLLGWFWC